MQFLIFDPGFRRFVMVPSRPERLTQIDVVRHDAAEWDFTLHPRRVDVVAQPCTCCSWTVLTPFPVLGPPFIAPAPLTNENLTTLLNTLSRRIVRVPERRGLLIADPEYPSRDLVPDPRLDHLQAASITCRIAIGPHG